MDSANSIRWVPSMPCDAALGHTHMVHGNTRPPRSSLQRRGGWAILLAGIVAVVVPGCRAETSRAETDSGNVSLAPSVPVGSSAIVADSGGSDTTADSVPKRPGEASASALPPVLTSVTTSTEGTMTAGRLILEFDGATLPGYELAYVTGPVNDCASGKPVTIAGTSALSIRLSPARVYTEANGTARPKVVERNQNLDGPLMRQLTLVCERNGAVTWVLGVSQRVEYDVSERTAPPRLVIDIRRGSR